MLGIGESSSPNFVISWSVMLECQRAVTGRCRYCQSEVIQPSDHHVKPRAIDTSGYSRRRSPAIADLGRNAGGTRRA